MIRQTLILLFVLSVSICTAYAQPRDYTTSSKKAIKKFEKAIVYFNYQDDEKAIKNIEDAIQADPNFVEPYLLLSDIYHEQNKLEKELDALEKAITINPGFSPKTAYFFGESAYKLGQYDRALNAFESYMEYGRLKEMLVKSEYYIKCCNFSIDAVANPVPFEPINLGPEVNSAYNDMAPSITVDGETLIITVDVPIDPNRPYSAQNKQEDFFISKKVDGVWQKARNMGRPVNTAGNEGMQSISADGKVLVYASSNLPGGLGSTDLYISYKSDKGWSRPVNMGAPVNSEKWDTQPTLSSDGKSMYFVSTREGGMGKQDIWFTRQDENGVWSEPLNVGDEINTPGYESSPFIHPDGKTLYFTSGSRIGLGGYDIYKCTRTGNMEFSEAENLGYPINTHLNEEFLVVNAYGDYAFISSKRDGSRMLDVYTFKLPEEVRPNQVTYMKGKIYDAETKQPVKANFELINLNSGEVEVRSVSDDQKGDYLVCLPTGENYAFDASANGYLFHSLNFELTAQEDRTEPFIMDIALWPIKPGKSVVLNNIFFETARYSLKEESRIELKKLVDFLANNPGIKIEIGGHTDNIGSPEYNQNLSENRAKSVFEYLLSMKVDKSRISYKGYGYTKPIDTNDTDEGKAKNRRTEFTILE